MKTETGDDYTWEDVIFENRNRNYGAYLVRRSYSRNASIAFGVSVSFAVFLLFLPQIISNLTGGKIVVPKIMDRDPFGIIEIIDPPPVHVEVVEPPPAAAKSIPNNLPPEVVTKNVDTVIPPNSELLAHTISTEGGSTVFVEEPTGSGVTEAPPVVNTGPVDIAEFMPEYIGGRQSMMKFFSRNFNYPRSAVAMGIEGTVFVSFVIDAEGNVVDVKVVRGVSAECDKEAIKLISKMPKWKAGMQNKQAVSVRMVLPIKFQITSN